MKKKSVKDIAEIEMREDDLEDEIIDLLEPMDEYLETIEAHFDLANGGFDDLADTLDEDLAANDIGNNKRRWASEDETHPDFEKTLLELFESSESAAAKLLEDEFRKYEPNEAPAEAGQLLTGDSMTPGDPRAQGVDEQDETAHIPEPEKEFSKNLFFNIEVVKEPPGREAGASQAVPPDGERKVTSRKTDWLDSGRYYPEYVQTIDTKIAEYEKKIEKLVHKKKKIKKTYEQLRSILYLEGEQLKKAVAFILAKHWSLQLAFMNKVKRGGFNENILIKHNNRFILVKIKGTHSARPPHKFITQVWQDLHYSGLGARADGALIVNHDIETDPDARGVPYDDEDAEQLEELIFVDTRVLHQLTTAIIDGDLSVEEARNILFTKGRVECKQSAI